MHSPRLRRAGLGELVQIDGSHHDWFEQRAAKCCLIAFIDDATGRVLAARFFPTETTQGYLSLLHEHASTHGLPAALYSDRHAIFTKHEAEQAKPTQFERALLQLDIEGIARLLAAIEHQDNLRQQGIRSTPTPANSPPRRFRPRPEAAQIPSA